MPPLSGSRTYTPLKGNIYKYATYLQVYNSIFHTTTFLPPKNSFHYLWSDLHTNKTSELPSLTSCINRSKFFVNIKYSVTKGSWMSNLHERKSHRRCTKLSQFPRVSVLSKSTISWLMKKFQTEAFCYSSGENKQHILQLKYYVIFESV